MEESIINSSTSNSSHHNYNELSQSFSEESSWTMYIEEFIMASEMEISSSIDGALESSSIISDASCNKIKLMLKKRKMWGKLEDDDPLEDTASSPVNSPKVCDVNKMKKDDRRMMFQEEEVGCGKDMVDELGIVGSTTNECTELKKMGLCVVPLSLFLDHVE
uniref:Uncharacterized protein n=1 Tax=Ananas comosus var. bracteatus TaxID=296719 RepID=A0A6V7NKY0_ANACO|nr:unnamed protein product [Ananas comosus var. bracteatus]